MIAASRFALIILVLLASAPVALAQDAAAQAAAMVAPADAAIDRGLKFLASTQQPDGSYAGRGMGKNPAIVALAGMAFLSSGSSPGRGPYGDEIDRAIDYLLRHTQASGFIAVDGATSHGPMYGHGFATLFLAEAYGMTEREDLRDRLASAIRLIISAQNNEGGWRYQPKPVDADISVTICQIMALRAARNAGIHVPGQTVERCIEYVKRCQNPDGGFGYTPRDRSSMFPRSAAGVVALYSAGVYDDESVESGLAYLEAQMPQVVRRERNSHFFYGMYYGMQAMWQAGDARWARWYPVTRDALLARQQRDGSWNDSNGPHYGTAMACVVLQIPNNTIPIFQR
ncbi:Prenyltransferase and squalene oxidase repeat protein [Pseudobythopirellula maris]|uniref:Prenyltransferase and squalene oxidase repeat protein n=1 Tax=Pseudobythopirellula maris TaxID=2527991 RepID=A0A5C5ZJG3_9BACT|nr:prenyltransferase/squalene oxidase repeat-containing protein [Pseudobythopirellula maris]TWT87265.1 Prenyltransferase and squalene oxidase repeat protein [Pseudobythopirellula maris]